MKHRGFTLIEVMIVIALIAFIAVIGAPLGGGWVRQADLLEVEGDLTQAFGQARAAAMRNLPGVTGADPVAVVCVSNTGALEVRVGQRDFAVATPVLTLPSCTALSGEVIWQTQLDTDVALTYNGTAFSCACFSSQGLLTTTASQCTACINQHTLLATVSGGTHETLSLY